MAARAWVGVGVRKGFFSPRVSSRSITGSWQAVPLSLRSCLWSPPLGLVTLGFSSCALWCKDQLCTERWGSRTPSPAPRGPLSRNSTGLHVNWGPRRPETVVRAASVPPQARLQTSVTPSARLGGRGGYGGPWGLPFSSVCAGLGESGREAQWLKSRQD